MSWAGGHAMRNQYEYRGGKSKINFNSFRITEANCEIADTIAHRFVLGVNYRLKGDVCKRQGTKFNGKLFKILVGRGDHSSKLPFSLRSRSTCIRQAILLIPSLHEILGNKLYAWDARD